MFLRSRKEPGQAPEGGNTDPRRALLDEASGLYQTWYFERRAKEEVVRSARYSHRFVLIVCEPRLLPTEALPNDIVARAGEVIRSEIRKMDLAGRLNGNRFAALLVEANHEVARSAAHRLRVNLGQRARTGSGGRPWRAGIAAFPDDGLEFAALVEVAVRRLKEDVTAAA